MTGQGMLKASDEMLLLQLGKSFWSPASGLSPGVHKVARKITVKISIVISKEEDFPWIYLSRETLARISQTLV